MKELNEEQMKKYLKGTTTLGFVCKEGVVLASDTRATMGYFIADKDAKKIYQIDEGMAITAAGLVGDNQALVRLMKAQIALYKMERKPMTVKAAATLLANILYSNKFFPYYIQQLVGGIDSEHRLYELDPVGGMSDKKFASTGSGSPTAYGVLENEYNENISIQDGIRLAVKGVKTALERDSASGNHIDVVTITKSGFKRIPRPEIEKIASEFKPR